MERTKRLGLATESHIILAICVLDFISTAWFITSGHATEGNPVMSFYLQKGWLSLVVAKATLSLLPIFVLEWCRRHRPDFVHGMLRFAIVMYVGLYLAAILGPATCPLDDYHSQVNPASRVQQQAPKSYPLLPTKEPRIPSRAYREALDSYHTTYPHISSDGYIPSKEDPAVNSYPPTHPPTATPSRSPVSERPHRTR